MDGEFLGNNIGNKIGDKIIDTIKSGDVKMRPRWFFVLQDILGATAIVMILLIAVYLGSFVIFVLHETGAWFVPVFGLAGWYSLFNALPWVLITLTVLFNVLLAILLKRYPFGYQWPLIYSILGIGFVIAAASFIGVQSSVLDIFFASPAARDVPFLGQYYPGIGILAPNDIHRGHVAQNLRDGFLLREDDGSMLRVFTSSTTTAPAALPLKVGDSVVVFGSASPANTVRAVGIEKLME